MKGGFILQSESESYLLIKIAGYCSQVYPEVELFSSRISWLSDVCRRLGTLMSDRAHISTLLFMAKKSVKVNRSGSVNCFLNNCFRVNNGSHIE